MADHKVEIDVRLSDKNLKKDFDDLEKKVKNAADGVSDSMDGMSDSMDDVSNDAKKMSEKAAKAMSTVETSTGDAKQGADDLGDSIQNVGDDLDKAGKKASMFGDILKGSLASAAIEKGIGLLASGIKSAADQIFELDTAKSKFAASTGLAADEMERYSAVMENLYKNNYGESIGQIADTMAMIKQYTGEIDPSKLESMTESALALTDTFDMDLSEAMRGVEALIQNMGLTADEAFDYIVVGAQNGLDKSGELADNIAEYSQLWSQAGFSAEEMFSVLQNGLDSGAYNLDKVNDFVKEFAISLSDGRIAENIDSFSSNTASLFEAWQNGEVTTKDVFYSVINDLQSMSSEQEALTLASNTWSALGEDNSMKVITSLGKASDAYANTKGAMEKLKEVRYDNLESQYQTLGRTLQADVIQPVLQKFLPVAQKGLKMVADNIDTIVPVALGAATAIGTMWVANKATKMVETVKDMATGIAKVITQVFAHTAAVEGETIATEGAAVAQTGLNTAMNANPVGLLITGISMLVTGLMAFNAVAGEGSAKQLADDMAAARDEAAQSRSEYEELSNGYHDAASNALGLYSQIDQLSQVENKSADDKARLKGLVDELNEAVPDLGLHYDELSDSLNKTRDSIYDVIAAETAQQAYDDAVEARTQAHKAYTDAVNSQAEAEQKAADLQKAFGGEIPKFDKKLSVFCGTINGVEDAYNKYQQAAEDAADAVEDQSAIEQQAAEDVKYYGLMLSDVDGVQRDQLNTALESLDTMDRQDEAWSNSVDALAVLTDSYTANRDALQSNVDAAQLKIDELNAKFEEAKAAAYNSIDSTCGLFQTLKTESSMNIDQMMAALDSQQGFVDTYTANLQTAMSMDVCQPLLEKLSDGSTESAGLLQEIVNGGQTKVNELNEKFMGVEQGKQKFSEAVGKMETDFDKTMEQLVADSDAAVAKLNNNDEAYTAAVQTIQGYINGTDSKRGELISQYESIADAVMAAYNNKVKIASPAKEMMKSGRFTIQGIEVGTEKEKPKLISMYEGIGDSVIKSYNDKMYNSKLAGVYDAVSAHNTVSVAGKIADGSRTITRSSMSDDDIKRLAMESGRAFADEIRDSTRITFNQREVGRMVKSVS